MAPRLEAPIGSFIFLGPTGIGKTKLARALAEYRFNSEDSLIKLDMSEFMERHTTARLVGSPPGYVVYDEGGQLTEGGGPAGLTPYIPRTSACAVPRQWSRAP